MEKNVKKADNRYLYMIGVIVCVVVLTAIVTVFVLVWGGTHEDGDREEDGQVSENAAEKVPIGELVIHSIEEQGDTVEVSTSYGVFKYPFAFSDIIHVEATNLEDGTALEFTAMIGDESYKLYTICFDSEEGDPIGKIKLGEKKQSYDVGVIFCDRDEKLDGQYYATLCAAQETFNDVMSSMEESGNFTLLN